MNIDRVLVARDAGHSQNDDLRAENENHPGFAYLRTALCQTDAADMQRMRDIETLIAQRMGAIR